MAKNPQKIAESYMAASLKKGSFLSIEEIRERDAIVCSYPTILSHFDSINNLRFACMCEMATWGSDDLRHFMEQYELTHKFNRNHPKEFRPR